VAAALGSAYDNLLDSTDVPDGNDPLESWVRQAFSRVNHPGFKAVIEPWLGSRNDHGHHEHDTTRTTTITGEQHVHQRTLEHRGPIQEGRGFGFSTSSPKKADENYIVCTVCDIGCQLRASVDEDEKLDKVRQHDNSALAKPI
jgi:hypothetical protein